MSTTAAQLPTVHPLRITAAYYLINLTAGFVVSSLGPTLEGLAEQVHTDTSGIGLMLPLRAVGFMAGGVIAGHVYDRVRGHTAIGGAVILLALILFMFSLANGLSMLLVFCTLGGAFKNQLDVGINSLLVRLHGTRTGPYMIGLHFFFGIGAFLAPVIVAQVLIATGTVAWAYRIFALLMLPPALVIFRLPTPEGESTRVPINGAVPIHNPIFWLIALLVFLYAGTEMSFAGWIATYARKQGLASEAQAAYLTSVYWGAITAGRLLSVPLAARYDAKILLGFNLSGALISIILLLLFPVASVMWSVAFTLGMSMAAIFPTGMVLAGLYLNANARVMSWIMISGGLGVMIFPGIIGQLIDPLGPQIVVWMILLLLSGAAVDYGLLLSRLRSALPLTQTA